MNIGTIVRLTTGGQVGRIYSKVSRKGNLLVRWTLTETFSWHSRADLKLA